MSDTDQWRDRLEVALAGMVRQRQARAAVRRDLDARRQAGLVQRHAQKLARNRQEVTVPTVPPCCAEAEEPPCPQHAQARKVLGHNGIRVHQPSATGYTGPPAGMPKVRVRRAAGPARSQPGKQP